MKPAMREAFLGDQTGG